MVYAVLAHCGAISGGLLGKVGRGIGYERGDAPGWPTVAWWWCGDEDGDEDGDAQSSPPYVPKRYYLSPQVLPYLLLLTSTDPPYLRCDGSSPNGAMPIARSQVCAP